MNLKNNDWLDLVDTNPKLSNARWSFSNQAREAGFKPYKALWSLQTKLGFCSSINLYGLHEHFLLQISIEERIIYIQLLDCPILWAMVKTTLIVEGLTNRLKVSVKSKPADGRKTIPSLSCFGKRVQQLMNEFLLFRMWAFTLRKKRSSFMGLVES